MTNYFRRGNDQFFFATTVASQAAPTQANIAGATELSGLIAAVSGFSFANTPINTPDMGHSYVSQIPGEDAAVASQLTFYDRSEASPTPDLRSVLAKGTTGYCIIAHATGPAGTTVTTGKKVEVWPMIVAAVPRVYDAGNVAATWHCDIAITAPPSIDVAVAA